MEPAPLSHQVDYTQVADIVHRFYERAREDELLAPYFFHIRDWPEHEGFITDFWWGVMGGKVEHPRPHAMEAGHRDLDFGQAELERWLDLFTQTLHDNLAAEAASRWTRLARRIGDKMMERGMLRQ